jgi:hypothetical protein
VVYWEEAGYWRRVAPSFAAFMALFVTAAEAPEPTDELPPLELSDENWEAVRPTPRFILKGMVPQYVLASREGARPFFEDLDYVMIRICLSFNDRCDWRNGGRNREVSTNFLSVEVDFQTLQKVIAAHRSGVGSCRTSAESHISAEKGGEDITEIIEAAGREAVETGSAVHSGKAELVIGCPFLRIAEYFIRLIDLLEFFFRIGSFIHIRMILLSQFPVCFFYFIFRSALRNSEHLIIIPFICHRFTS